MKVTKIKFIQLVLILFVSGCGLIKSDMQPVVIFHISVGSQKELKQDIIFFAKLSADKHKLNFFRRDYNQNKDIFIHADRNGWMYAHGLTSGDGVDFSIYIDSKKIQIIVSGLPNNPEVHDLIADWEETLNKTNIKFKKEIIQNYLNNKK